MSPPSYLNLFLRPNDWEVAVDHEIVGVIQQEWTDQWQARTRTFTYTHTPVRTDIYTFTHTSTSTATIDTTINHHGNTQVAWGHVVHLQLGLISALLPEPVPASPHTCRPVPQKPDFLPSHPIKTRSAAPRCYRGYQGFNRQFNRFGTHCIETRPALVSFAMSQNHSGPIAKWNDTSKNRGPPTSRPPSAHLDTPHPTSLSRSGLKFNGLEAGQEHCIYLFPAYYLTNSLFPAMSIALAGLGGLTVLLWFKWIKEKRQERREIQQYLDMYSLACRELGDDEVAAPPAERVEVELDEGGPLRTSNVPIPGTKMKVCMVKRATTPTGGAGKFVTAKGTPGKGLAAASSGENDRLILELHLREHLRRMKINIDHMIEHEHRCTTALSDFGLFPGRPLSCRHSCTNPHTYPAPTFTQRTDLARVSTFHPAITQQTMPLSPLLAAYTMLTRYTRTTDLASPDAVRAEALRVVRPCPHARTRTHTRTHT